MNVTSEQRRWGIALLALVLVPCANAAGAQTTAIYGGSPNHIDLSLPVTASIGGRCWFASPPSGSYNAGEIRLGFTHDFSFTASCNSPFRVAVVSANGGLRAPLTAPTGYSALAPYDVTLHLAGDSGVSPVTASCAAATLAAAAPVACSFRGPSSSATGLKLSGRSSGAGGSYLRVSAPPYSGVATLLASTGYQDTLTVSISASP